MSLLRSACRDTLRTLGHGEGRGKGERCERAVHRGSVAASGAVASLPNTARPAFPGPRRHRLAYCLRVALGVGHRCSP